MNIAYSYEVKTVDSDAGFMEIEYTADGKEPILVGAHIPYEDDDFDAVVASYAPYSIWIEQSSVKATVDVGKTGRIEPDNIDIESEEPTTLLSAKSTKRNEIKEWRKNKQESFIQIDGFTLKPNQKTIGALRAIKSNILDGVYSSVNYRFSDGSFGVIDLANIDSLISKVSVAIQNLFDDEKAKTDEVNAMTDIDAVNAYSPSFGTAIPTA